ncbi:tRNA lysidine(34) synthetase TilS [Sphingomonas gei]|uniref:tRNA(Ile)-lysidine synthase n=2 Tax=Sphingomonas gei TaxID=1395960 RepID=A0A4S1XGJ8_9SPHN|nr:tRNA lysidine(34) synthetase TilS [Sphingomonas gei]
MLLLARAAVSGRLCAATVNHGLRAAAADEAAMVAELCRDLAVPHTILTVEKPIEGASIQARARDARYAKLLQWALDAGAGALATAHHADDQAETFLMRAARGSGTPGLAGIRARRLATWFDRELLIVRPLLKWRRDELRAIAEAAKAPFVDDPSNTDPAYDRTRFRELIAHSPELDVPALAASAAHAAEAEHALMEIASHEWLLRRRWDLREVAFDPVGLSRGLLRRLTQFAIDAVRTREKEEQPFDKLSANGESVVLSTVGAELVEAPSFSERAPLRGESLDRLLATLDAGGTGTIAGVKASARHAEWRFSAAPPRRSH